MNPKIKVLSTYHPGELSQAFVDPEWGAATAKQAIDQGADVIFVQAVSPETEPCRKSQPKAEFTASAWTQTNGTRFLQHGPA